MTSAEETKDLSPRAMRLLKSASIPKLEKPEDFPYWLPRIHENLKHFKLNDLIDPTIPKPSPEDPKYDDWKRAARTIECWLVNQIDWEIVKDARVFAPPKPWPDEYLEAVREAAIGTGHYTVRRLWFEAIFIKRSDYDTIEEFVLALEKKIDLSRAVDMDITPFQAAMLLLENIKEEMPMYVEFKFIRLRKDSRKTMSEADFYAIAREVRAIASVKKLEEASSSKDNNSKRLPPKRSPLQGQSADDHRRYWFSRKRRSPDNFCPYCREERHDTEHCPYLEPSRRSLYWSPRPNIWWRR